jgi:hypothetical protein
MDTGISGKKGHRQTGTGRLEKVQGDDKKC